ncbi:MAG: acyl-CoA thioesterase [Bacteroidia bacterium]|jgi:acyl-CoA thioester hydrolase|nr:acyl-CoA thioesterase [Bacteroidia bacterium]
MHIFNHKIRVRYAECDQMGFVHHSVYAVYFEEARTESLRGIGITYKEFEDSGIIMPVRSLNITFKKAALYDDLLDIQVTLHQPEGIRCLFEYETRNQNNELLNTATMELFFARKADLRPMKLPAELLNKF